MIYKSQSAQNILDSIKSDEIDENRDTEPITKKLKSKLKKKTDREQYQKEVEQKEYSLDKPMVDEKKLVEKETVKKNDSGKNSSLSPKSIKINILESTTTRISTSTKISEHSSASSSIFVKISFINSFTTFLIIRIFSSYLK